MRLVWVGFFSVEISASSDGGEVFSWMKKVFCRLALSGALQKGLGNKGWKRQSRASVDC
ncbi:AAEL004615-PA [Aedes aegypti]|uniref:AAEL004615-PA n=1 Tax=Aedes aegypti TaxID=7159 RepID=Q17CB4_AEDAE|nr:AAEL004615-PA [Aedes aegypti]